MRTSWAVSSGRPSGRASAGATDSALAALLSGCWTESMPPMTNMEAIIGRATLRIMVTSGSYPLAGSSHAQRRRLREHRHQLLSTLLPSGPTGYQPEMARPLTSPGAASRTNRYSRWPLYTTWFGNWPLAVDTFVESMPGPITGVPVAVSAGQFCAHVPVHAVVAP